jgi:hypothetical protein
MRSLLVIVCVIGCGKGSGDHAGSGGTSAPPGTTTAPSGGSSDCTKSVQLCTVIAASHVDALCGTKSPKTVPTTGGPPIANDGCKYNAENNASNVEVARLCLAGDGGLEQAKMVFKASHDKLREQDIHTDVAGMGDEAYLGHPNGTSFASSGCAAATR